MSGKEGELWELNIHTSQDLLNPIFSKTHPYSHHFSHFLSPHLAHFHSKCMSPSNYLVHLFVQLLSAPSHKTNGIQSYNAFESSGTLFFLINTFFSGQKLRCRHREKTCGHNGIGESCMNWESTYIHYMCTYIYIYIHVYIHIYTYMCKIGS